MKRDLLIAVCITLVLAASLTLRRKPEQMACASDTYAKALTAVRNVARHGRGEPPLACLHGSLAWLP